MQQQSDIFSSIASMQIFLISQSEKLSMGSHKSEKIQGLIQKLADKSRAGNVKPVDVSFNYCSWVLYPRFNVVLLLLL